MEVVTKYKEAARIANAAIEQVLGACTVGASVVRLFLSRALVLPLSVSPSQ